ncbi:MAG TPA: hypothetical protein VNL17_14505 [Verrucomicrobiae bacterium]|nr:hypothetical protein [Verrucomicrobiae bacterium]
MPVKFTVDHVKAAQQQAELIRLLFDELRRFANESTHMDDPLHPARLEAKTILDSSKFRDMPDALLSLSKALVVFQAKYDGLAGAEEASKTPAKPAPAPAKV